MKLNNKWGYSSIVLHLYRGSYMSAHFLLNLLNELGKSDKMRGLQLKFKQ